ncbi:23S rRNA (guanosine(2251)-2'-O)-methyltransferase RlmB [Spiroplasma alleghenense]|uniref:23S rRNA (Guanosine2251-2'-O)-methyltransferase n=1 Tax=Spiroplasma alleghenense TaxID=216931 RepID=A0A345Z279_9MOLU|nr:23S rRNA (guanosine(2251)-2'-O)-methyltransferase RlmB [Spiroplasma alleghenense]AXK50708.1 23S rRNA (guanosine2251-2'-O)-methyltransferase [Spiroplasma alleghenense]
MNNNYIYGKNAVTEFVENFPDRVVRVFVTSSENASNLKGKVKEIKIVEKEYLDKILNTKNLTHQNIVLEYKQFNYRPFKELSTKNKDNSRAFYLILDQIHDPYNFGAIIRSAVLMGVDAIIILDHRQVEVTPTVIKASGGTAFYIDICRVTNLANAIKLLKEEGFWIYSSNLNEESQEFSKVSFDTKTTLILGNENKGVGDKITKISDVNIHIPTLKVIDSLNVSVAAGILIFNIARQLQKI